MAIKRTGVGLIPLLVGIFCGEALAQSGCTKVLLRLSPCLNFISGNSSSPSSSCCAQLASVVQTQPKCLCTALGGNSIFGITINQTRALELPGACNVKTPPVSQCNNPVADEPATSPAESPIGSPIASPSASTNDKPADQNSTIPSDLNPSSGSRSDLNPSPSSASSSRMTKSHPHFTIYILSAVSFISICSKL